MNNVLDRSFTTDRTKSLHNFLENRQMYQKYLRELQQDQQEETLQQISQYAQKNCKYLQKYFQQNKDQFNQCGGRHNELLTSLYQSKDYQKIDSRIYSTSTYNFSHLLKPVNKTEKVVIKRKILNDYMNIINKRQEIMNQIEENFIQLFEMHQGTLLYYNKYYSKQNQKQYDKLLNILLPEFRYILKFVSNKGRQFESRLRNYSDVKHDKINKRVEELGKKRSWSVGQVNSSSQFIRSPDSSLITRVKKDGNDTLKQLINSNDGNNYESQKNQYQNSLQKKAQFQKIKFENLAKSKGYFYLENTESVEDKYSNFEMQKYGSDKMKLKIFEQDMKQIIKEKKIPENNQNNSQESIKKISGASINPQATSRSEEKQKKSPRKNGNPLKGEQKKINLLKNVKQKIQNFKRLSGQGQYLQDLLNDKHKIVENNQKNNTKPAQSQSKQSLSIQKKLSYVQKRQSTKNLDLDFHSPARINSKSSLSQLYQMKEYQSFHDQPLILKDDVSFKKFKEKYFSQDDSKEEEIKPYINQISLKELRNSSLPTLPLTINELKTTLINKFALVNQSKHQKIENKSIENNKIIEIEEENCPSSKNNAIKQKITKQSDGFSEWVGNSKQGNIKGQKKTSFSNVSNKQLDNQEDLEQEEDLSPQINYFKSQQLLLQQKQKLMQQKTNIQNQPHIQLPKEDIFIFKKLNKIYLEKIYEERILNNKFQHNVQPLYSPEQINEMKTRHSSFNIFQLHQAGVSKKSKKSRLWKSVPFLPDYLIKHKNKEIRQDSDQPKIIQKDQVNKRNNLTPIKQNQKQMQGQFFFSKQPTLEVLDVGNGKKDGQFNSKEETHQQKSLHPPSLKGITTYSELNSMITDPDFKTSTPLPQTPLMQQYFNFNQIQTIQEEVSLLNQKSTSIMQSQAPSQNMKQQDAHSNSSSSDSSISNLSQIHISKEKTQNECYPFKAMEEQNQLPKILQPSKNKYHLRTEGSNLSSSQIISNNFNKNQNLKTSETQSSPVNQTISTTFSQSQGLLKQFSNDSQVYPSGHDFIQEKAIQLSNFQQKNQNRNSLSFLSNKSVTINSQNQNGIKRKSRSNNHSLDLNKQSLQSSQFKQDNLEISPIIKVISTEMKGHKKRNSIQKLFKFGNQSNIDSNQSFQNPQSSAQKLSKQQIELGQQLQSLNEVVQGLSKEMITQQYGIQKLSDKAWTNQRESIKLYSFLNKKYDLCIEKKEKSFKKYIEEINLPLQEQLSIAQKEKLQQRLSVSEQFKLDKQLNKLSKPHRINKLSIISNMSQGSSVQHDIYSPRNSLPQSSKNIIRPLPQNAADLLLSIKKSKQIITAKQSQDLTERLTQFESKTQKDYTRS